MKATSHLIRRAVRRPIRKGSTPINRLLVLATATAGLSAFAGVAAQAAQAATCTPTGFIRDGINLTAASINPGTITGPVDATGCNIGVYYDNHSKGGSVSGAEIFGANYYGVVDNASPKAVNVTNSQIHNIGDPSDGTQHGVGVFYTTLGGDSAGNDDHSTGAAATGTLSGSAITAYQKNGVVINGPGASVAVTSNTVTGSGPNANIAQNGIEFARGATGSASSNTVIGNEYTGAGGASSAGFLVFGGPEYGVPYTTGINISNNKATNNDVGVWLSNADSSGNAPLTPTKNSVVNNTISKIDGATNTSGGTGVGYQAGVADQGKQDTIASNNVSGYTNAISVAYDLSGHNHVNNNSQTP